MQLHPGHRRPAEINGGERRTKSGEADDGSYVKRAKATIEVVNHKSCGVEQEHAEYISLSEPAVNARPLPA
jgi:hypothetical protein